MDLEVIENILVAIVQAKLPAKLIEINTKKNDGIVLENIPNENYFNEFYTKPLQMSLLMSYGFEQNVIPIGGDSGTAIEFYFNVLIEQPNQPENLRPKVIRYARALQEIIEDNSNEIHIKTGSLPEIILLSPELSTELNMNTAYRVGGIHINLVV